MWIYNPHLVCQWKTRRDMTMAGLFIWKKWRRCLLLSSNHNNLLPWYTSGKKLTAWTEKIWKMVMFLMRKYILTMESPHIPLQRSTTIDHQTHSHSTACLFSLSLQKINLAVADSHPSQTTGSCSWSPIPMGASRHQFLPHGPQGSGVCPHAHTRHRSPQSSGC